MPNGVVTDLKTSYYLETFLDEVLDNFLGRIDDAYSEPILEHSKHCREYCQVQGSTASDFTHFCSYFTKITMINGLMAIHTRHLLYELLHITLCPFVNSL